MSKISDKNGIYNLDAVVAITATNDKERTAVLYFVGGERIGTTLAYDDVVKLYNPAPAALAPAAPEAPPQAPTATQPA